MYFGHVKIGVRMFRVLFMRLHLIFLSKGFSYIREARALQYMPNAYTYIEKNKKRRRQNDTHRRHAQLTKKP